MSSSHIIQSHKLHFRPHLHLRFLPHFFFQKENLPFSPFENPRLVEEDVEKSATEALDQRCSVDLLCVLHLHSGLEEAGDQFFRFLGIPILGYNKPYSKG